MAELLKRFHDYCAKTVLARETLNLHECGAPLLPKDVERARNVLRQADRAMFLIARDRDMEESKRLPERLLLFEWQRREIPRVSPEARTKQEEVAVGWALTQSWTGEPVGEAPEGINPKDVAWVHDLLLQDPGVETLWEARIVGAELWLRRCRPGQPVAPLATIQTGSPLGWIRARRSRLELHMEIAAGQTTSYGILPRQAPEIRCPLHRAKQIQLSTDCGELKIGTMIRPDWARRMGRDRFGLFLEFDLDGVLFRLRWVPPGSFLMGSPEDEKDRYPDEVPHRVTLTRGYWLASTPCTQEQWQAVMGRNPSHFKGSNRPVESVDWQQCREFCARLQDRVPALEFRLPTEAEWEYACRAGTTTAFNDGSACTKPEGKDPALERLGWHGEGEKGETHPVGELAPNSWGLYDMHGNVWEWCADYCGFEEASVVTDTYVDGAVDPLCTKGAWRVVRGGSAWISAGRCRSAIRGRCEPGGRDWSLGFRLAAGQPVGSGATGLEAGGAERRG